MSKTWQEFEDKCYNYLVRKYSNENTRFEQDGRSDSTVPDIKLIKNDEFSCYIEVKMNHAQSGQFVVLPVAEKDFFVFSPKNKTEENEYTQLIINHMNKNFYMYNDAGTAGADLEIDQKVFNDWIINKYKDQNVKYIITEKNNEMILIPIDKFGEYFNISAKYRIKKSGSSEPAKSKLIVLSNYLENEFDTNPYIESQKKLFVSNRELIGTEFDFMNDNYLINEQLEVRKLSKTYNMNVIFSINLNKAQDEEDIAEFEYFVSN